MLIQQLNTTHQGSMDRYYRTLYESLLDPRLLTSSKQALYLNLLFKSLRSDLNVNRVKAFTKRLLQVVSMHQPSFACGALYMLRELEGTFAGLSTFIDDPEANESDEEEAFRDVAEPEDGILSTALTATSPKNDQKATSHPRYDPRKREPLHSNAAASSLWELLPFLKHYHPSVSLFAARLLTHDAIPPKPDLSSHTLIHFLDRFVYRNPKSTTAARGASIMQPIPSSFAGRSDGVLLTPAASLRQKAKQPVNSEAFWKQAADDVGADEVFFHRYFSKLGKGREKAREKKERKKKAAEEEGSDDDEEEEEIWKALVESRPEIEGDDDGRSDDEDLDMDDMDDEMDIDLAESGIEDAPANKSLPSTKSNDNDDDDDDIPDLGDDDEALLASDDEIPSDLEATFEKETLTAPFPGGVRGKEKGGKRGKRKLKNLPVFADADDYAKMLEGEEEGGVERGFGRGRKEGGKGR